MKLPLKTYLSALAFIWLGYVAGISFLEAPLKFQAPGITLSLGLGIGRIVFATLNKVEWVLAVGIFGLAFLQSSTVPLRRLIVALVAILICQTVWLLPYLDARAETIIAGGTPPASSLHWLYIALEAAKLPLLFIIGIKNLQAILYDTKS